MPQRNEKGKGKGRKTNEGILPDAGAYPDMFGWQLDGMLIEIDSRLRSRMMTPEAVK